MPENSSYIKANTHVHSPYSFSSFDSIEGLVRAASAQGIAVLGINDFNTCEGFGEFQNSCRRYGIYPLFNIEFLTFSKDDLANGLRWNSNTHPGAFYLCGKGLRHPVNFCSNSKNLLASLWKSTQDHIWKVIHKLNDHLHSCGTGIELDYNRIRSAYAKNTVRERHLAKALYLLAKEVSPNNTALGDLFRKIFQNRPPEADCTDAASVQLEIIERLFSPGAPAYMEKNSWELSFDQAKKIILEAGGIPCYPVLADDRAGFTEMEKDACRLARMLLERGIHAVEFIPRRNSPGVLKHYVEVFRKHEFCITFGTEHNTSDMIPLLPAARDAEQFDHELLHTAEQGACLLAAHQKQHSRNQSGFVDDRGKKLLKDKQLEEFLQIGKEAVLELSCSPEQRSSLTAQKKIRPDGACPSRDQQYRKSQTVNRHHCGADVPQAGPHRRCRAL